MPNPNIMLFLSQQRKHTSRDFAHACQGLGSIRQNRLRYLPQTAAKPTAQRHQRPPHCIPYLHNTAPWRFSPWPRSGRPLPPSSRQECSHQIGLRQLRLAPASPDCPQFRGLSSEPRTGLAATDDVRLAGNGKCQYLDKMLYHSLGPSHGDQHEWTI